MTGYSPRRRGSILSDMADIAQDLWASLPEAVPAEKPTAVREEPTYDIVIFSENCAECREIRRFSAESHLCGRKIAAFHRAVESGG